MQLITSTTVLAALISLLHAWYIVSADIDKRDISLVEARNTVLDTSNKDSVGVADIAGTKAKANSFNIATTASSISKPEQNRVFNQENKIVVKRNSGSILDEITKSLLGQESSNPDRDSPSKPPSSSSQSRNTTAAADSTGTPNAISSTTVNEKGGSGVTPMGTTTTSTSRNGSMNTTVQNEAKKKECPCNCLCESGSIPRSGMMANSSACAPNKVGSTVKMVKGTGVILSSGSCACSCLCPSGSFSEASGNDNSNTTASSPKLPAMDDLTKPPSTTLSEPAIISQPTPVTNPSGQVPAGQEPAGKVPATALSEPAIISQPTPVTNPSGQAPAALALPSAIPSPLMSPLPLLNPDPAPVGSQQNGIDPININSYSLTSSLNLGSLPSAKSTP